MRINEILSEIDLSRRKFLQGIGSVAGASGLGFNPAAIAKTSKILEIIKGLDFTGLTSFGKLTKLLKAVGPKNKIIIQQIKSYFDRQHGPGDYSAIPYTTDLLTNVERETLATIISKTIGRTITYDETKFLDESDIRKIFPTAEKNPDISPRRQSSLEWGVEGPKTIKDYSNVLRWNPPHALKLLGINTEAYSLQEIVKELAKKNNGIDFDDWHDNRVTNRLFPTDEMPNPKLTKSHRFWDRGAKESLHDLWQQHNQLTAQISNIKYDIRLINDHEKTLPEEYKELINDIMTDYNKLGNIGNEGIIDKLNYDELLKRKIQDLNNGLTKMQEKFDLFQKSIQAHKNRNKIFDELKQKLSQMHDFLDSSPYTNNQQLQQKYKKDLEIKYNKLRNEYFDLSTNSITPDTYLKVVELEKKLDAVLVSLGATKDIGLDLMERRKKQRS